MSPPLHDERTPLLAGDSSKAASVLPPPTLFEHIGRFTGALQEGSLPSTAQTCRLLDALLESKALAYDQPADLRTAQVDGTALILAVRKFLLATREYLATHLANDALQDFLYHSRRARIDFDVKLGSVPDLKGSAPDTEEIKDDAQIMLAALNTLVRLLLSNILATGQSILDDFFYLTRSTLADGSAEVAHVAQEVADTLRPDHPTSEDAGPVQADQVEKQTGDLVQTIEESKEAVIEAAADLSTFKGRATLAAENDFREVATARFHKLVNRVRDQPAAAQSSVVLLDLLHKYVAKTQDTVEAVEGAVDDANVQVEFSDEEDHASLALDAFRKLLEGLAQTSQTPLILAFNHVMTDIRGNHELSAFLNEVDHYVRQLIKDPAYASSDKSLQRARELYDRAAELREAHAEWKADLDDLFQQAQAFYGAMFDRQHLLAMQQASADFTKALAVLLYRGPTVYKQAIYSNLFHVLIPRLATVISYFPVPRAEFTSPAVDVLLDDFLITEINLLPTFFRLHQSSEVLVQREADYQADETVISMTGSNSVYIRGLRCAVESVSFWMRRKNTWFSCFQEEYGLLAVSLLKRGLELSIDFDLNDPILLVGGSDEPDSEKGSFTTIKSVKIAIPDIDLSLTQTKHRFLFWLVRPAVKFALRAGLRYVLSSQVKQSLEALDRSLFKAYKRAHRFEDRGEGAMQAWIDALMSVQEDVAKGTAPAFARAQEAGQGLMESAEITSTGILIAPEGADYAINVGAPRLLPDASGPDRYGPHGGHGGGSMGRIAAQADQAATAGIHQGTDQAVKTLEAAQATVDILVADKSIAQEGAARAHRYNKAQTGWRTQSFDI